MQVEAKLNNTVIRLRFNIIQFCPRILRIGIAIEMAASRALPPVHPGRDWTRQQGFQDYSPKKLSSCSGNILWPQPQIISLPFRSPRITILQTGESIETVVANCFPAFTQPMHSTRRALERAALVQLIERVGEASRAELGFDCRKII